MQKKIVAAICAAALALAMPAAAFGITMTNKAQDVVVNGSDVTYTISEVDGAKAKLLDLKVFGNKDMVKKLVADATSENAVFIGGSNVIATQSFAIECYNGDNEKVGLIQKKGQTGEISGTIAFKWDSLISTLPATIDVDNLYTSAYAKHTGDNNVEVLKANNKDTEVSFSMDRCSIVTAVLSNGKVIYNPAVGVTAADGNTTDDLNKAAADSSKSPKTGDVA